MSFWDLSDGGTANEDVQKEYEAPGVNMEPIPNNSDVLATIKAVKWATKPETSERFIEIQWTVQKPEEFFGKTLSHKLWVDDLDPSVKDEKKAKTKRDKSRHALATIDANAKGRLLASNEAPTDDSLALALVDASMVIKVMEWVTDDQSARGNWINYSIKPKDAETRVGKALPSKPAAGGAGSGGGGGFMDDEIPF